MKKLVFLLLSVSFLSISTAKENYYPLEIGNQWHYESLLAEFIDGKLDTIIFDTLTIEIIGDTIMPNGLKYFNVKGLDGGLRRMDSSAKVYEYNNQHEMPDSVIEYLLWDFSLPDTMVWIDGIGNPITIHSSDQPKSAGKLDYFSNQKTFTGAYMHLTRVFSLGIGESFFTYGCLHPNSENTLIYAKVNGIEYNSLISDVNNKSLQPEHFSINELYPNPFNESTRISFSLFKESYIQISIYNVRGQLLETLYEQTSPAGTYNLNWDASNFESGVYFINFILDQSHIIKKCVLVK